MNKHDLVFNVVEQTMLTIKDVGLVSDAVLSGITEVVTNGEKVRFVDLRTFVSQERAHPTGLNAKIKETTVIPKSTEPVFKFSKAFKDKGYHKETEDNK